MQKNQNKQVTNEMNKSQKYFESPIISYILFFITSLSFLIFANQQASHNKFITGSFRTNRLNGSTKETVQIDAILKYLDHYFVVLTMLN